MYQPYPPAGQPAGPQQPPAPAPVLAAVKLMYAGAAVSTINLIILLVYIGVDGVRWTAHPGVAAAQISQRKTLAITLTIVFGLALIAVWLWMARANGQGRNWARVLSTVLFGLATLNLTRAFRTPVISVGFLRRPRCQCDLPRADLAGRPGRSVAAVAPGLQRVLQATARRISSAVAFSPLSG